MIGVDALYIDGATQAPRKLRLWGETEAEARAKALRHISVERHANTGFKLGPAIDPKEDRQ